MAEPSAQDVVNQTLSVDDYSSIDVSGNVQTSTISGAGEQWSREAVDSLSSADNHKITSKQLPNGDASDFLTPGTHEFGTANVDALVNGDSLSLAGSEDTGYQHSVGVDTDTDQSKGDVNERQDNLVTHNRSNSIAKKPAAFKPVSVTKNFLAKTGAGPAAAVKPPTEKGTTLVSGQTTSPVPLASKPRLVAKSGRDARSTNLAGPGGSLGPDASKVWNRNRPAPAPQPKQFTDEELKQQYGIHMATRLQADEAGKESKWADIDDDEEDWAPETVEWMDGTKSTIHSSESPAAALAEGQKLLGKAQSVEPSRIAALAADGTTTTAPAATAQRQNSISGVGKTILRPGARLQSVNQTKPGLVLKNAPDSPVPTPSNPATPSGSSSKSPWAQLPPIEKVPPVAFVPTPPQTQSSSQQAAPEQISSSIPPRAQSPTREIAADDFDRSWRENDKRSRELFNSQSGRYEPVRNVRRWSRQESGGFRQPSLLQRPSPQSPNENAKGTSPENRSWARQNSSNLEDLGTIAPLSSPTSSKATLEGRTSADGQRAIRPDERGTPTNDQLQAYSAHGPDNQINQHANVTQEEDPHVLQQRLMRERIERNRKRKQEEEAREEAAKRERIKQKMEALGPAPPKEEKPQTEHPQSPSAKGEAELSSLGTKETTQDSPLHTAAPMEPLTLNDQKPLAERGVSDSLMTTATPVRSATGITQPLSKSLSDHDRPSSVQQDTEQLPGLAQVPPIARNHGPPSLNQHTPWSMSNSNTAASQRSKVWGPPGNDRPLGNGSFESDFNRIPGMQLAQTATNTAATNPGPIAPPQQPPRSSYGATRGSAAPSPLPNTRHVAAPGNGHMMPTTGASAWQKLPAQLEEQEKAENERAIQEFNARIAEEQRTGVRQVWQPTFLETYRQTTASEAPGQRQIVGKATQDLTAATHERTEQVASASPSYPQPPPGFTSPVPAASANGRASRFFGPGSDLGQPLPNTRPVQLLRSPGSPPPPPAELEQHPVYEGNPKDPRVKFPLIPRIRLPPAPNPQVTPTQTEAESVVLPTRPFRSGPQPLVNQAAWQDRFNGLFGRRNHTQAAASSGPSSTIPVQAMSSSREAFNAFSTRSHTTVSLPQVSEKNSDIPYALPSNQIESRLPVEDLMDEREFGDLPKYNLPKTPYLNEPIEKTKLPSSLTGPSAQFEHSEKFRRSSLALSFDYLSGITPTSSEIETFVNLPGSFAQAVTIVRKIHHEDVRAQKSGKAVQKKRVTSRITSSSKPSSNQPTISPGSGRGSGRGSSKPHISTPSRAASAGIASHPTSTGQSAVDQQPNQQRSGREKWAKPTRGSRRTSSGVHTAKA